MMTEEDARAAQQEEDRVASIESAMEAEGVPTHESAQADYFGFDVVHTVNLPDKVSWIQHRELNEGQRRIYLNALNREAKIQKATGDTVVRLAPGDERAALLKAAMIGWNLSRAGQPVTFNDKSVREFLEKASPRIIDLVEKEVRKANPWLLQEVSVEDIDKEIEELQELRAKKIEEESGKTDSSGR